MTKAFDLSRYELLETATLTFKDIGGEDEMIGEDGENPVTIELFGTASKKHRQAAHKLNTATQQNYIASLNGSNKIDTEKQEEQQNEFLVACSGKVTNFPLSPAEIYSNPKLEYMKEQVDSFLKNKKNYKPK
jgi:hypothetical protein